jgi:ribosomal protein L11 methyltransferase
MPDQQPEWRRLIVDVAFEASDVVQAIALDEGALGIEVEDDETRAVPDRAFAPTGRATVIATFPRAPGLEARVLTALRPVAEHFPNADMDIAWTDLFSEDWNAAFKAQWKAVQLTDKTWVVPSWERTSFDAPDGALVLWLDPGVAFGTGTHETTQLCAQGIEDLCATRAPGLVLDVGTGSGILSILALKLGVQQARGTEIDPNAARAALANARDNDVGERFTCELVAPDHWGESAFEAVVANVLAEPLDKLAPAIARATRPGGVVMLSGLLVSQKPAIAARYREVGLAVTGEAIANDWLRLDLTKPA